MTDHDGVIDTLWFRFTRRALTFRTLSAAASVQGAGDHGRGLVEVKRLDQVVKGAAFHRPDRSVQIAKRRDHDDGRRPGEPAKLAQGREPVDPRQANAQNLPQRPADACLVIYDQDTAHWLSPPHFPANRRAGSAGTG